LARNASGDFEHPHISISPKSYYFIDRSLGVSRQS
jgi:hypothetical protein